MRAAAWLLCACLCGCLNLRWNRLNVDEPTADAALADLRPGSSDLTECLAALGAPELVWEHEGDGMALAWAWGDAGGWGFSASYSFYRYTPSASFNYDSADDLRNGVVLLFDATLTLQAMRRGYLGDLVPGQRRPAPVEETAPEPRPPGR